ncbi:MAG: Nuclear control of ATPase protein 2 [Piccolia ochrophora]|nr:MAG: Nuclear control of ATPase protein 2 [Piccolia ochrophora]
MSLVADHISRIDALLDKLYLTSSGEEEDAASSGTPPPALTGKTPNPPSHRAPSRRPTAFRVTTLHSLVKSFSTTSSSRTLLRQSQLEKLVKQASAALAANDTISRSDERDEYDDSEEDIQWLLIGKAAAQTYGLVLSAILNQTIPLDRDIRYWEDILRSFGYTGLYSLQTSPLRLWAWIKDILQDVRSRSPDLRSLGLSTGAPSTTGQAEPHRVPSLAQRWGQFYHLLRQSIEAKSVSRLRRKVVTPFALSRSEAKKSQTGLKQLREMGASGLGVLMDEGLNFDAVDDVPASPGRIGRSGTLPTTDEWKTTIEKSILLIENVLPRVTALELKVPEFEDAVFTSIEEDTDSAEQPSRQSAKDDTSRQLLLAKRLQILVEDRFPKYVASNRRLVDKHGRPPRWVRYWLPAVCLLLGSSTLLRVIINRKADIQTWAREFAGTVLDFWENWVLEPTKRIIGTVRHDKDSEIAIMSKASLEGDRASLERMVVDFAVDNPGHAGQSPLSDAEINDVRAKVKEGDLTPVLKAYEKDLQRPFMGTIRGDLIRALLIQIQKTKVDVEVALGGIDALLKSQELVFGCGFGYSLVIPDDQADVHTGSLGLLQGFWNIDRILASSASSNDGMLSYKEHGLVLCEIHALREHAVRVFPSRIYREFLEEAEALADIRTGVEGQSRALERTRWAYGKWLR